MSQGQATHTQTPSKPPPTHPPTHLPALALSLNLDNWSALMSKGSGSMLRSAWPEKAKKFQS